jgi:hypothetical protein
MPRAPKRVDLTKMTHCGLSAGVIVAAQINGLGEIDGLNQPALRPLSVSILSELVFAVSAQPPALCHQ